MECRGLSPASQQPAGVEGSISGGKGGAVKPGTGRKDIWCSSHQQAYADLYAVVPLLHMEGTSNIATPDAASDLTTLFISNLSQLLKTNDKAQYKCHSLTQRRPANLHSSCDGSFAWVQCAHTSESSPAGYPS